MTTDTDRHLDGVTGARVCVAGLGVSGPSIVRALLDCGARVVAVDDRDRSRERTVADELTSLGAEVRLGDGATLPDDVSRVVTSPGWRPDSPLLVAAAERGVPVWGDVELAHRLRPPGQAWLGVTGTNGKTTTVEMLAAMLRAAGHRAVAAGNVGFPLLDAVRASPAYDVLAVEVSSFQLHWTLTAEFEAAAILNVAADHLDWHGSPEAYAADKALIWRGAARVVSNADDPVVLGLAPRPGVAFTLADPGLGPCVVGVRAGTLVETPCREVGATAEAEVATAAAAGHAEPVEQTEAVVLADVADVRPPGPHNVANALAAAALARSLDHAGRLRVPPEAVRRGLRAYDPGAHRIAHVATVSGVDYVDDSKATNAHAAAASLTSFPSVVWVAGGLAKGARFDDLVAATRDRLRAAVLIGQDRALVAEALARHAPEIPVVEVAGPDTGAVDVAGVMDDVVRAATGLARAGDTVLLAPACASMDMFRDYAERGDAFAAAVLRMPVA